MIALKVYTWTISIKLIQYAGFVTGFNGNIWLTCNCRCWLCLSNGSVINTTTGRIFCNIQCAKISHNLHQTLMLELFEENNMRLNFVLFLQIEMSKFITIVLHERHAISIHHPLNWLFNSLCRPKSKWTPKPHSTGPLCGDSTKDQWIPLTKCQ